MAANSPEISVVLLTYNEEENVRHALESVTWCDDVVVVDSFSSDRTEEICRSFPNVRFYQHKFKDLASQRQWAMDEGLPRHNWILALDADEVVTDELRDDLFELSTRNGPDDPVGYDIAMRFYLFGKWIRRCTEYPLYWRRFFRADRAVYVQRGHADTVDLDGPAGKTAGDLHHENHKSFADWIEKHNRYSSQEAEYFWNQLRTTPYSHLYSRDRMQRRRALKRLFRSAPMGSLTRFVYMYVFRMGFLDGRAGFDYCVMKAWHEFIIRLKCREIQAQRPEPSGQPIAGRVSQTVAAPLSHAS